MKPLHWLSAEWVLFFCCYVWKQSNMVHEKKSYCNTSYVQTSWVNVLLLGPATIKTYGYACDFHHWHFLDMWNHEPYLCMGFDYYWRISASIITLTKKKECHHRQDDHACLLPLSPVIMPITFWWLQYHCIAGLMWLCHSQRDSVC